MEMPWEHPTTGDYAMQAARNAGDQLDRLEKRVDALADSLLKIATYLQARDSAAPDGSLAETFTDANGRHGRVVRDGRTTTVFYDPPPSA